MGITGTICSDKVSPFDNVTATGLPCAHLFHKDCMNRWRESGKTTCPVCRHPMDLEEEPRLLPPNWGFIVENHPQTSSLQLPVPYGGRNDDLIMIMFTVFSVMLLVICSLYFDGVKKTFMVVTVVSVIISVIIAQNRVEKASVQY